MGPDTLHRPPTAKPADPAGLAAPSPSVWNPQGLADHRTPLIRNCWYVAALAHEVSRQVISRRLLGVDVALYRTLAGAPVAVRNRCPHRSFPLAKGRLEGDVLVCGYHGMGFEPSGRCVAMPSLPAVPGHAAVRSYPIAERGPLLWIWLGHPDHADERRIPDTAWLASPAWKTVSGAFQIDSDYVAMHENLLDQTHFPFLHPGAIGTPAYARSALQVREQDGQVVIERALLDSPPPGVYAMPTGMTGQPVDRHSEARFVSPALHTAFARIVNRRDASGQPRTWRFNISHIFTPESAHRIHYWWFCSRDFSLDDAAIDQHLHGASTQAYQEDVDALQWILDVVRHDTEPQTDLQFASDKPGLMMRRLLHRQARAEAGLPA